MTKIPLNVKVLRAFVAGPLTATQAQKKTKLSRAAVYSCMRFLGGQKLLTDAGPVRQGTRGACAQALKLTAAGRAAVEQHK